MYSDDNFAVGNVGPVFLIHWKQETTIEAVKKCNQFYSEMISIYKENVYTISLVEKNAPLPFQKIRKIFEKSVDYYAGNSKASALVFFGTGNDIVAKHVNINFKTGRQKKLQDARCIFCSEIDDAVKWIAVAAQDDERIDKENIKSAVEEFITK